MSASPWSPRARTTNARALLLGGLVGGHAALLTVVGISLAAGGTRAAASAAIAAVVTIAFFAIGQAVQVAYAEAEPRRVLVASLASYFLRVGVLGGLLALAMHSERVALVLVPNALFAGAVVTVIGWLAVELLTWRKLRFPVYDTEYRPASQERGAK